jgi:hypothetical protein
MYGGDLFRIRGEPFATNNEPQDFEGLFQEETLGQIQF